jgi:hypothetical protein
MSAGVWRTLDLSSGTQRVEEHPQVMTMRQAARWTQEDFAREQIRGLVRQVFFSDATRPVRQIIFTSAERETDLRSICRRVGEALGLETAGSVAIVGEYPQVVRDADADSEEFSSASGEEGSTPLRGLATRLRGNVWLVPGSGPGATTASLHSRLCDLRREFDYSIVVGSPAGESNEAATMAQLADGIILVLSAHRTRRVAARKIKETLERSHAHLLGTVLSDRVFPIPERIYRRL